jgi:ATP-dependent DNA helicase RecQ
VNLPLDLRPDARETLKRVFGHDDFRHAQRAVIDDVMAGHDTFVLLPTGSGKSLCYQLPALLTPGLTVVVSPLIALMKNQVDALHAAGVEATFLNSSLEPAEASRRLAGLRQGRFRLLYVAPERLLLDGFLRELGQWNVARFAVDEAHCISEWGHDFRPEYRRLVEVRDLFPGVPVVALTATANERVRADILQGLRMRAPRIHVASFNRPNLSYRVRAKDRTQAEIAAFVKQRPGESGIVYVQSRAGAERVADGLRAAGIAALPYHAGLDAATRARHQERFARDDVQVICATIAFGMGIDKSNVRFVIHHDVPKSLEGYYQETGRAGRDGLPAECVLFFSYGDLVRLESFLAEAASEKEAARARSQLEDVKRYVYANGCRRAALLAYFGEVYTDVPCGGCDNCLEPKLERDATPAAQKFLSCLLRIREAGGYDMGVTHAIDVLLGIENDKIWRLGHDRLSTFGIGKELDRRAWRHVADELLRLGYMSRDPQFAVVAVSPAGRRVLSERAPIAIREAAARSTAAKAPRGGRGKTGGSAVAAGPTDDALFERLRRVRRELADSRDVPAYVIFSDAVLRELARVVPRTLAQMRAISGVGDKKLAEFGERFLEVVRGE